VPERGAARTGEREGLAVEEAHDGAAALQREPLAQEEHLLVEDELREQAAQQRRAVPRAHVPGGGGLLHEVCEEAAQEQRLRHLARGWGG